MATFTVQTIIEAPVASVWETLANIGNISAWNPGVQTSRLTTEHQSTGTGACRYCNLGGSNYLEEEVVVWEPGHKLTMRINDTNLPFKTADIRFTLTPRGETVTAVSVSPVYELKYGWLGRLLDRLSVRRTYRQGMEALLAGLKQHQELRLASAHPHQAAGGHAKSTTPGTSEARF